MRQAMAAYRATRDQMAGTDDEFGGPPEGWTVEEAIERIRAQARRDGRIVPEVSGDATP
jgi:hypothetical protein